MWNNKFKLSILIGSSDNQNSNYSDRIHELRDDNSDPATNERFIINLIKESMEKDKLRDKVFRNIRRSNIVFKKRNRT